MDSKEKAELLKDTIFQLWSKEGRSKSYISRLLEINRKTVADKIKEWGFPDPEPIRRLRPSSQKFLNANRDFIKKMIDQGKSVSEIAKELHVKRDFLRATIIPNDKVLTNAIREKNNRAHTRYLANVERLKEKFSYSYSYEGIEGEKWKDILGFPSYQVSNQGRIRSYSKRYSSWQLFTPQPNRRTGRWYVQMKNQDGKAKNLSLSRIVAHAFVDGYEEGDTVNHVNGDINDNRADNLEWVSQAQNDLHSYRSLHRQVVNYHTYIFDKIVYKDKYEFKTVAAFARFLDKSETQTRRYLDEPEKYDIKLV